MRWNLPFALLAAAAACSPDAGALSFGHLTLERTSAPAATLGDLRAHAFFCARDSLLTVLAAGPTWSTAIAMRTPWPPARHFMVDTVPHGIGIAAIAVRPLADTSAPALIARSGTLDLDTGIVLGGRFAVVSGPDSGIARLAGRFDGMRPDTTGCSTP